MADGTQDKYDVRRQARGTESEPPSTAWRRRMIGGTLVVMVLLAAGGVGIAWHRWQRVYTVSARVQAATVTLAPIVDARLTSLLVREGEKVERGQVVAGLDATELSAALETAEATRRIRQSRYAEAQARHRLVQAQVKSDIERAAAAVLTAEAIVARTGVAVQARRGRLVNEIRAAEARRKESEARLRQLKAGAREEEVLAAEARLEAARALQALYELEWKQSQQLAQEGIDSQHLLEMRRTRTITQETKVREARLELRRLQAGPTTAELEVAAQVLAGRAAELASARAGSNEVAAAEAELAVREAELQEARARERQAQRRQAEVEIAEAEMRAAEAELQQAQSDVAGRRAVLDNRDLVSPVDGIVVRTFVRVGEVARKGEPCVVVAEENTPRWVEGFVREEDAMRLVAGQRAWIRAPASSGEPLEAVLEQVGLHTTSQDGGGAEANAGAGGYRLPERVWVRLRPVEPLKGDPVTGTSAHGVILVR